MKRPVIAVTALLAVGLAGHAAAEVAVHTVGNRQFKSVRADVRTDTGMAFRWKRINGPIDDDYLNPDGDARGDLPPQIVLIPAGKLQADPSPLVLWSRQDMGTLAVYWSVWSSIGGWSEPKRLSDLQSTEDVGVKLFLDPLGDVHAAWSSGTDAPAIYYSKFAGGVWGPSQRLTPPLQEARNPTFDFSQDRLLFVTWEDWTQKPIRVVSLLREGFDP